jgi:hypothetical protein
VSLPSATSAPKPPQPPQAASIFGNLSDREWAWIFCAIGFAFFMLICYAHAEYTKRRKLEAWVEVLKGNPPLNPVYNRNSHQPLRAILPV